jgi:hypothetical protein
LRRDGAVIAGFERGGLVAPQQAQRRRQDCRGRQRHLDARRARIERDRRMQVIEVVGDQQADERQVAERRFAGPVAQQAGDAAELVAPAAGGGNDLVGAAQQAGNVRRLTLAQGAQVGDVAQIGTDQLDRRQRLAHIRVERALAAPFAQQLRAADDFEAIAQVEAEDHLEARQQLGLEEARQIDQRAVQRQPVVDIARQDELALRRALVSQGNFGGPTRRVRR